MTREEAVARIKDHIEIHRYHERNATKVFEALDMAIEALRQPERKKGKWILDQNGQFRCSNCEQVPVNRIIINAFLVYDVPTIKEHMKYCPMCGARME